MFNNIPGNVGVAASGAVPVDTDRDGMPDAWEKLHALNPDNAEDRSGKDLSADGYTNIEMYINESAGDPVVFSCGKVPAHKIHPSPKGTYRADAANFYGSIEIFSLQGRLVYKGKPASAFLPPGLSIIVEQRNSIQSFINNCE